MRKINVCIARIGGTNCDLETKRAFEDLGVNAQILHTNKLIEAGLKKFDALVFPGGFSYGDYVRAGAIWAKQIAARLGSDLRAFAEDGKPILGICNGFQLLIEAGLLPGFDGVSKYPQAALAPNVSARYECRWVHLKHENRRNCIFTKMIQKGKVLRMPVAHVEGRFIFPKGREGEYLKRLKKNDQLVLRYCDEGGEYAGGEYPENPNSSFYDIAGICNSEGNIFGLMPHPERAYYGWQLPDWTSMKKVPKYADGKLIFESMIEYLRIEG